MSAPKGKVKFLLWAFPDSLELVRNTYKKANCRSQSEFIEKAIQYYAGRVNAEDDVSYLPTIFGGFAPNSSSAEVLSKALGSRTVMSGSVSRSKNDPSQSLQMIERPLLTPDELKSLPKGQFVVMKTGVHPMRVKLKLFFKWAIEFDEKNPYVVPEHGNRQVAYAERKDLMDALVKKYNPDWLEEVTVVADPPAGGMQQVESPVHHQPVRHRKAPVKSSGTPGDLKTAPPNRRPRYPENTVVYAGEQV